MPETHFDEPQQIDKHFDVESKTAPLERCVTSQEVVDCLQISKSTLTRRIDDGTFPPPFRIGRKLRWTATSIQQWLDEQREGK